MNYSSPELLNLIAAIAGVLFWVLLTGLMHWSGGK